MKVCKLLCVWGASFLGTSFKAVLLATLLYFCFTQNYFNTEIFYKRQKIPLWKLFWYFILLFFIWRRYKKKMLIYGKEYAQKISCTKTHWGNFYSCIVEEFLEQMSAYSMSILKSFLLLVEQRQPINLCTYKTLFHWLIFFLKMNKRNTCSLWR